MKTQQIVILLVSVLLLLVVTIPVTGQSDIIVNGADARRDLTPAASPNFTLDTRMVLLAANQIRYIDLVKIPAELETRLAAIPNRIVLLSANTDKFLTLTYPRTLLNDTTAPVVNNFANTIAGTTAKITWDTDEFARSTVHYGTQSGNYTGTVDEPLYAKHHEASLADVVAGTTYYVQITCTDQSDNVVNSAEFSFTIVTTRSVFLPLIRR